MEFESGHCGYTCWNPSVQYERYRYALFVLTRCVQRCRPIAPQPPQPQPTSSTPLHFEPSHPVLEFHNPFSTQTHPFSVPGHSALSPAPAPTPVQTPAPPAPARPPPAAAAAGVAAAAVAAAAFFVLECTHESSCVHSTLFLFFFLNIFCSTNFFFVVVVISFWNARTIIRMCVLLN